MRGRAEIHLLADPEFNQWTAVANSGFPVATFQLLSWAEGLVISRAQGLSEDPTLITNLSEACAKLDQLKIVLAHHNAVITGGKTRTRAKMGECNNNRGRAMRKARPLLPKTSLSLIGGEPRAHYRRCRPRATSQRSSGSCSCSCPTCRSAARRCVLLLTSVRQWTTSRSPCNAHGEHGCLANSSGCLATRARAV